MVSYVDRVKQDSQRCGVLILIVVEDGLVHTEVPNRLKSTHKVLILIVVEDGLVLDLIRLF